MRHGGKHDVKLKKKVRLTETSSNCFSNDKTRARRCGRVLRNNEYKKPFKAVGSSSWSFFLK